MAGIRKIVASFVTQCKKLAMVRELFRFKSVDSSFGIFITLWPEYPRLLKHYSMGIIKL